MPKVSVVIPTHGRVAMTEEAVASVLRQTYEDFEVIVFDDGSGARDAVLLSELPGIDDRVKVFRSEERIGGGFARERALSHCSGELIATLDSDDLWFPSKLERQVAQMEGPLARCRGVGIVACGWEWVDGATGQRIPRNPIGVRTVSPIEFNNMSVPLFARWAIEMSGGFVGEGWSAWPHAGFDTVANIDFYVRASQVSPILFVPGIHTTCRTHSGQRTSDYSRIRGGGAALDHLIEVNELVLSRFPQDRRRLRQMACVRYMQEGQWKAGAKRLPAVLSDTGLGRFSRFAVREVPSAFRQGLRDRKARLS